MRLAVPFAHQRSAYQDIHFTVNHHDQNPTYRHLPQRPALYHIHQPQGRYLAKPSHRSRHHHILRHLQHHHRSTVLQECCTREEVAAGREAGYRAGRRYISLGCISCREDGLMWTCRSGVLQYMSVSQIYNFNCILY
ncbi:hypothetical protein SERLA73DRAFT_176400, partial [Serpula lacrymans var. lacrymans S7.3]